MDRRTFLKSSAAGAALLALEPLPFLKLQAQELEAAAPGLAPLEVIALTRMGFGPSEESLEHFRKLGNDPQSRFAKYLEEQCSPQNIEDGLCENRITQAGFKTLHKTVAQLWNDHFLAAKEMIQDEKEKTGPGVQNPGSAGAVGSQNSFPSGPSGAAGTSGQAVKLGGDPEIKMARNLRMEPVIETEQATWIRAVYSKKQLNEALVRFWHDHFNVYGYQERIGPMFVQYDRDVIRQYAWGNFREFLEAVAKSPAMLVYLDNGVNQSGNPNENYARELFELHTLGAENYLGTLDRQNVPGYATGQTKGYVDGDVYESARCFTGWRLDEGGKTKNDGEFDYFEQWHDRFQKIVLGHQLKEYQPPLKDAHDVLDILAHHPGTAHHIAMKLCRRFVSDSPPKALVERVAGGFHQNVNAKDQLKKVMMTVLSSREFHETWGEKVKRPFEFTVGMLRATQADFFPEEKYLKGFERTGHGLFQWRTPDGYPDVKQKWIGTNSMLERWRTAEQLAFNRNEMEMRALANVHEEAAALAKTFPKRFLGFALRPSSERAIAKAVGNFPGPFGAKLATALIFMSPDYQWS